MPEAGILLSRLRRRTGHRCRGLTLLELLVVLSIMAISICAALELATGALRSSARAQRIVKTAVLAQNEIEYWRAQGGAKLLALGEGDHAFQNPFAAQPDNKADETTLTVRKIEDGIVEATAVASLGVEPQKPAMASITTWLSTGGTR
jgi:prepilin-type N-terminal cleavage/methylation domain-containing protein